MICNSFGNIIEIRQVQKNHGNTGAQLYFSIRYVIAVSKTCYKQMKVTPIIILLSAQSSKLPS